MNTFPPTLHTGNRQIDQWANRLMRSVRTASSQPGALGTARTPHGTIQVPASRRLRAYAPLPRALPSFFLYKDVELDVKVTGGIVSLFGSPAVVDPSDAITVPDDTDEYKIWLQWVQADSPALTFGNDTAWPTLVDFYPIGRVTTASGAITAILNDWTGGTIVWPARGELSGVIPVPANATYSLAEYVTEPCLIERVAFKLDSGSLTAAIKINGTAVTSLSAISVTSTQSVTAATGANSVGYGQRITLVVSSISTPANLAFTLGFM